MFPQKDRAVTIPGVLGASACAPKRSELSPSLQFWGSLFVPTTGTELSQFVGCWGSLCPPKGQSSHHFWGVGGLSLCPPKGQSCHHSWSSGGPCLCPPKGQSCPGLEVGEGFIHPSPIQGGFGDVVSPFPGFRVGRATPLEYFGFLTLSWALSPSWCCHGWDGSRAFQRLHPAAPTAPEWQKPGQGPVCSVQRGFLHFQRVFLALVRLVAQPQCP